MSLNLRNLGFFLLLAGTAAATWMLAQRPDEKSPIASTEESRPRGYFLSDAVLLGTNESGRILFRAHVDRVEKLIDDDNFVLDGIRIEYAPASEIHWQVFAQTGLAPMDLTFFDLSDGVRMTYSDATRGNEAVVEMEAIHLDALQSLASSEDAIVVRSPEAEISATGLEADLGRDMLVLKSDVTAHSRR
jgi:LPS export ABC transporter protein LptC